MSKFRNKDCWTKQRILKRKLICGYQLDTAAITAAALIEKLI